MTIRHVVIWSLHNGADAPRFKALLDGCKHLVPGIEEFEVGIRSSELEANADVVLVSTFSDAAALAAYQQHPHHLDVAKELGQMRSGRHVVDYFLEG